MKDNIDRLLEAVEHPERFSDAELNELLDSSEACETYYTMRKTADVFAEASESDIDAEWRSFAANHARKKYGLFRVPYSRPAAAVVIAIIASIAVVAATLGIKNSLERTEQPNVANHEFAAVSSAIESESIFSESSPALETIVFRDATLESIVDSLCVFYGVSANYQGETAKALRLYFKWNQEQPLGEVIDQLNSFGQISIDLKDNSLTVE